MIREDCTLSTPDCGTARVPLEAMVCTEQVDIIVHSLAVVVMANEVAWEGMARTRRVGPSVLLLMVAAMPDTAVLEEKVGMDLVGTLIRLGLGSRVVHRLGRRWPLSSGISIRNRVEDWRILGYFTCSWLRDICRVSSIAAVADETPYEEAE